jgi:CRP-like cAMP-binding protein
VPDLSLQRTSRELFLSILTGGAGNLETWVIDRMTSVFEEEDVEAGKRLYAVGELPEHIFFIREGAIRLEREGVAPWLMEGRSVVGAFDAILERPHLRTAVAVTPLRILRLRVDLWLELLEDSFGLARAAIRNSVANVAAMVERFWALQASPRAPAVVAIPPIEGPLTFVERVGILAGAPLVRMAGIQVLVELAEAFSEVTFEAGETIFERGVSRGQAFLVLTGEAEGSRHDPELRVRFGPGSWVGGLASLGAPILAWEAHAVTRVRTLAVHLEDYLNLMEEHFDLVRAALAELARLREVVLTELERTGAATRP